MVFVLFVDIVLAPYPLKGTSGSVVVWPTSRHVFSGLGEDCVPQDVLWCLRRMRYLVCTYLQSL